MPLSVTHQNVFAENTIVFSANTAVAVSCTKTENLENGELLFKLQKGLFWFGYCVACFVLNGWLCGVNVLLCFCSSFNFLWFFYCVFGLVANVCAKTLVFFQQLFPIWLVLFFCLGLKGSV